MKLLFVHDHPFYKEEDIVYSGGGLPFTIWDNYLINFDKLLVYGRLSQNLKNKKIKSSTDNVSFYLTDKYISILSLFKNKKSIENELKILINEADVVLTRLPSVLGFFAGFIALKQKKPLWVEQVANAKDSLNTHGSLMGKIAAPFFEFQNKKLITKADFVSYVTENKLQRDYPSNPKAITVSISNVLINYVLEENDIDNERFNKEIFRIGLIGGFDVRYKGQDILLKAVALLDEKIKKNIKISFVGKGNPQWVEDLAYNLDLKNTIEYVGSLEAGEEINNFLKTLSLYVQPSLTEGMPRATIEAMAMGCPVIGSDVGGLPDIVTPQYIHEKGNYKQLATHLEYLYNHRKELHKEAHLSIDKSSPYLKSNLNQKRLIFYKEMNKKINNL